MLPGEPTESPGELRFRILDIPVRIHWTFWLIAILPGLNVPDPGFLVAWVLAVFVGILVHEMGHALAMRSYGFSPLIVLYGLGGLTSPGGSVPYRSRGHSSAGQIAITLAGPGAGFLLSAAVVFAFQLLGRPMARSAMIFHFLPMFDGPPLGSVPLSYFFESLVFIGIFWGAINLLPVYPLDGGQVAREVLLRLSPSDGMRTSLVISLVVAVAMAVTSFTQWGDRFLPILFAYLAYTNFTLLQSYSGRGPY